MDEPRPSAAPDPADQPDWRSTLQGKSPRELLPKLIDGDPLGLDRLCKQRIRSQALLLDPERLRLRAIAHVARHGVGYRGSPPLDVWLGDRIRASVRELLAEDAALAKDGPLADVNHDPVHAALSAALGISPALILPRVVAFNRAAFDVRTAFVGTAVGGASLAEWAEANAMSQAQARAVLKRALWVLGVREGPTLDDFLGKGEDDA